MASTSIPPTLPPELILMIIHEILSSPNTPFRQDTLEACSFVCHQWHALAHPLVFHTITLTTSAQLTNFLALIDRKPSIGQAVKELTAIVPHMVHPSSYRTPRFSLRCDVPASYETFELTDAQIIFPDELKKAVYEIFPSALPSLQSLSLYGYTDTGKRLSNPTNLSNLSLYSNLHTLLLDSCKLPPLLIEAFAYLLPNLRHYHTIDNSYLDNSDFDFGPVDEEDSVPSTLKTELNRLAKTRPTLTTFSCYAGPSIRYDISLKWLLTTPTIIKTKMEAGAGAGGYGGLTSLSIMFEIDAPEPFREVLEAVGPRLEHLSLEVEGTPYSHWIGTQGYETSLPLAPLTSLRTLLIRANVDPSILLSHFLSQLTSPHLSLLVIVLTNIRWLKTYFPQGEGEVEGEEGRKSIVDVLERCPAVMRGVSLSNIRQGEDGEQGKGGEEARQQTRIIFANDPLEEFDEEVEGPDPDLLPPPIVGHGILGEPEFEPTPPSPPTRFASPPALLISELGPYLERVESSADGGGESVSGHGILGEPDFEPEPVPQVPTRFVSPPALLVSPFEPHHGRVEPGVDGGGGEEREHLPTFEADDLNAQPVPRTDTEEEAGLQLEEEFDHLRGRGDERDDDEHLEQSGHNPTLELTLDDLTPPFAPPASPPPRIRRPQTVAMLKRYIDGAFEAHYSKANARKIGNMKGKEREGEEREKRRGEIEYEVMSLDEARVLCVAKPIEL